MKKKIINGILLVAMLFAATTSFVSCKDNVDDEILPVYAQLTQTKNELSTRISSLEGQIASLQSELSSVKGDVTTIKGQIADLQSALGDLKTKLATVEGQIATLSSEVDNIKKDMKELGDRLTDLEYNVAQIAAFLANGMVTEIAVNHTVNDVIGSINFPGVNVKMLAALFGDNQTYIEDFPATGADYNVFPDGATLDASDIAGAKKIELNADYITKPNGNAGKLFFTANSLDKSLFNINDWTLSMEASNGNVAPVHFDNVKPSNYVIQWGLYKSQVLGSNEAAEDKGFYEADATIEPQYLEQCKLNARNYVNFGQLKDQVKAAVERIKAAKGEKATITSLAKETAQLVENLVSGQMSGNNRYLDNPTYAAQRLVMTRTVEENTVRFQDADLDVALTAIGPLSYNSFWQMEKNVKAPNLDRVENAIARLVKSIKKNLPKVDVSGIEFTKIEYPDVKKDVSFWYNGEYYTITPAVYVYGLVPEEDADSDIKNYAWWIVDEYGNTWYNINNQYYTVQDEFIKPIIDAINAGLPLDDLNDMIQSLGKIGDLGNTVDKVAARFSNFIERTANAIVTAIKEHALTRAVSPIILYSTTQGVNRLVPGTVVKAGTMQINMTSPTEELIVPPYEKYIAVKNASGKITQSATIPGNTQLWTLDLNKAGDYTVILSCVDYYGYVVTKKYDITVVE